MAKSLGMGTILHRIETCLAVALQTGSSCLIDDSHFPYDRGNLGKYYEDLKICSSGEQRKEPERFISVRSPKYLRYILNVPAEVKRSLEFCHEDTAGWYRGVILKHMLHLRDIFCFGSPCFFKNPVTNYMWLYSTLQCK